MRLDKFVSQATGLSRSQCKALIKQGRVAVSEKVIFDSAFRLMQTCVVKLDGRELAQLSPSYIALNKPQGFICSTIDEVHPSALNLLDGLPGHLREKLHFAGRLDVDTTGLCLITSDGKFSHRVTAPSKACRKTYEVMLAERISQLQVDALISGLMLKDETAPVKALEFTHLSDNRCLLTIAEGRYHQVKRMFGAVGNRVVALHRISVGSVTCESLAEGEWRYLTEDEIAAFN